MEEEEKKEKTSQKDSAQKDKPTVKPKVSQPKDTAGKTKEVEKEEAANGKVSSEKKKATAQETAIKTEKTEKKEPPIPKLESTEQVSSEKTTMEDIKSGQVETLFSERGDDVDELDVVARGKVFAFISYIWGLCLVPVFLKKKNKFAIFHAKQGLLLLIWYFAACAIKCVSGHLWLVGTVLGPIAGFIKGLSVLLIFVLSITGMYQAWLGNYWRLPFALGDWADEFEINE